MTTLLGWALALVVVLPVLFGLVLLLLMWRSWWLYPVWDWYLVPLGLPHISFWHFTALIFLVNVLTNHPETKKDDRKQEMASWVVSFLWPIIVWGILRWMHG